jgi:hypothetical protein
MDDTLKLRTSCFYDDEGDLTMHKAYESVCGEMCKKVESAAKEGWHIDGDVQMILKSVGSWGAGWSDEHYGGVVGARCVMVRDA